MMSLTLFWDREIVLRGARFVTFERVREFVGYLVSLCVPAPGDTACGCEPGGLAMERPAPGGGGVFVVEGWIGFPVAIADGTATGTVFLEASRQTGLRARVVANLAVERGGYQNWIHFRLPFGEELELEEVYGLRATLVATDLRTGQKRLFGTPRAAAIQQERSEAGVILELEEWD
jgi:hypothetical protein